MIIRVMGDGQYRVDSALFDTLNAIDDRIVGHVQDGDQEGFRAGLAELTGCVRREGKRIADAEIVASDIIVPPSDLTLAEARDVFKGVGLFSS